MGSTKKRKRVRTKGWDPEDLDVVTRERRRHRGRDSGAVAEVVVSGDYFTDIEPNGIVVSPYGVLAFVSVDGVEHLCRVADNLVEGKSSILAPGDRVCVEWEEGSPVVCGVAPRRTKLSRFDAAREREQVAAANVDLAVIVASTREPAFKPGLVDRYLIVAGAGGVTPLLCLNKIDLVQAEPPEIENYRQLGLAVVVTSCVTGNGLDELRAALSGKLSVFSGHSGVGKSTILNKLCPGLDIPIQDISASTGKGRHTTTTSRLYDLGGGTRVIDTPGIRQLGVGVVSARELEFYFPEMVALAGQCRFRDCTHIHEPVCAVQSALETGHISRLRYDSYRRIRESL